MATDTHSSHPDETTLVDVPESDDAGESSSVVKEAVSMVFRKVESVVLYGFHEVPPYQQDNHFILSGYRGELQSFKRCVGSLWYLHNETGSNLLLRC